MIENQSFFRSNKTAMQPILKIFFALFLVCGFSLTGQGQQLTVTYDTPGSYSADVPSFCNTKNVSAQVWGAGGGGGGARARGWGVYNATSGASGGAGGGYSSLVWGAVTGNFSIQVGQGGLGGPNSNANNSAAGNGTPGGPSTVTHVASTVSINAGGGAGGLGAYSQANALGNGSQAQTGTTSGGTGNTQGGNGLGGAANSGGGSPTASGGAGGAGAGPNGGSGGTGTTVTATGGADLVAQGQPGNLLGGGGSGACVAIDNTGQSYHGAAGGNGANGRAIISYNMELPAITGNATYCEGDPLALTVSNPCSELTYTWKRGGIIVGTGTSLTVTAEAGNYTVEGSVGGYAYTGATSVLASGGVSYSSGTITLTSAEYPVTVDPIAKIELPDGEPTSVDVCVHDLTYTLPNWGQYIENGTGVWTINGTSGVDYQGTFNNVDTYTLNGDETVTFTFSVYNTSTHCQQTTAVETVELILITIETFFPEFNPETDVVCSNDTKTYTLANVNDTNYEYEWNITGTAGWTVVSGGNDAGEIHNYSIEILWGTSGTATISVTVTDPNDVSCITNGATVEVTVNALPDVSITGTTTICAGSTTQLSPTTGGTWTSSNDAIATVDNLGVVTGVSAGSATFTFTDHTTNCSNITLPVTVEMSVGGTIAESQTVCYCNTPNPLILSDYTGAILGWESSLDNFATPGTPIANITNTLTLGVLDENTYYRAIVKNGDCPQAYSNTVLITVTLADGIDITDVSKNSNVNCVEQADPSSVMLPVVTDACNRVLTPSTPEESNNTVSNGCGEIAYTWTYEDCAGNDTTWTYTYTIEPVADILITDVSKSGTVNCVEQAIYASVTLPVVTDACNNVLIPSTPAESSNTAADGCGQIAYTWTYEDCAGHDTTWTYTYTIEPVAGINITDVDQSAHVNCVEQATAASVTLPVVTDACNRVLIPSTPAESSNTVSNGCGQIAYTWTYEDCAGHDTTWTYTYIIEPAAGINITDVSKSGTVSCVDQATVASVELPVVTDACENVLTPSIPEESSNTVSNGCGQIAYTWTYEDCAGHDTTWTYTYTIEPIAGITITDVSKSSNVNCVEEATSTSVTLPVVTDACDNVLTPNTPIESSNTVSNGCGQIAYTWTYEDCAGHDTTWTYTYTIEPEKDITIIFHSFDPDLGCNPKTEDIPTEASVRALIQSITDGCGSTIDPSEVVIEDELPTGDDCNKQQKWTLTYTNTCGQEGIDSIIFTWHPSAIAGTVSPAQTICTGETPEPLTLTGNTGNVLKWQYADDIAFTLNVVDIYETTNTISSIQMGGELTADRYYRAVVQCDVCTPVASDAVKITVNPLVSITLVSVTGTNAQIVRANSPIDDIIYAVTGVTDVEIAGLPAGINGVWSGDVVTISGAPTETGLFNYVIAVKNDCETDTAKGTITVKPPCPAQVTDTVNDITYNTIDLVGYCWYQENVRGTLYQDSIEIPFAKVYYSSLYPDMLQNALDFGLLYTYNDLLGGVLCPEGWRLPTSEEWALLNRYNANDLRNPHYWLHSNINTNSTEFDARGAGFFNSATNRFENLYGYTAWWSSDASVIDRVFATSATLNYYCSYDEIINIKKTDAISVRCLMDE